MTWRSGGGALALVALLAPMLLAEPKLEPLRPSEMDGTSLVFMGKLLTVEAPGEGWEWVRVVGGDAGTGQYICRKPATGEALIVIVVDSQTVGVDVDYVKGLASGIAAAVVKQGGKADPPQIQDRSIPVPQSYRLHIATTRKDGSPLHYFAYVGYAGHPFLMERIGPEVDEPEILATFARSTQVHGAIPEPPKEKADTPRGSLFCATLAFIGLCSLLGRGVNALARRPLVNGPLIGTIVIGIAAVIRLGTVVILMMRTDPDPTKAGEMMGQWIFDAALPALIGFYYAKKFSKTRAEWEEARLDVLSKG